MIMQLSKLLSFHNFFKSRINKPLYFKLKTNLISANLIKSKDNIFLCSIGVDQCQVSE